MTSTVSLQPIEGPSAWRGDELVNSTEWIYHLSEAELADLEEAGRRFVADDPDLRTVTAADYPIPACERLNSESARQLDSGLGMLLVRGLRTEEYGDVLAGAIFYILGLHLGRPIGQNQHGDLVDHIIATSNKTMTDAGALPSRVRDRLTFHSDSSDVVALMALRGAKEGGASTIISAVTIYNEILRRRPELAHLLFEPFHWDWRRQDPDSAEMTFTSPIISYVDGVFSTYTGMAMIFSAQQYEGVPRLTDDQIAVLRLFEEITQEPGLALDMHFQPGDVQWLLNYTVMHSRTAFIDHPEPERRRHLLRLWLRRDVGRPLVPKFGKHIVEMGESKGPLKPGGRFHIADAVRVNESWGN